MLPSICILTFTILLSTGIVSGEYDGYYDLSARDTGYLCSLMDEYKRKGTQPDIINHSSADFPKSKYLRQNNECWKMRWNPCDESDISKTKPCGWYNMQAADNSECT